MKKWKKPTKNFYMMPNEVFNLGLDPYEFMILSYLVRRMNADSECWPSIETMHQDLGISISTLEDRIAKMCKRKLISIGKYASNRKYRNNVYTLYSLENPEIYRDSDVVENEELPLFVA
ncbi:MAG: helix-turn-helix domain-containing protein [Oscillospiraceae bacterium]|nr:helix-turn-helix domain-containing protein [Oscillospiraceae bacterium]